ncbi:Uncharacterized protein SCG7086_BK_00090 [Chlamydiales bacterium SCGC AG-110-P3]|nr:Uncharacterized protein SCG7086_BK_00090 [Chlamydiales bacterium SCGC AG-110-P3]
MTKHAQPSQTIETQPSTKCYLCGSQGALTYSNLSDRLYGVSGTWSQRRCNNNACGLVWLDPIPKEKEVWKLYEQYFTHGSSGSNKPKAPKQLRDFSSPYKRGAMGSAYGYSDLLSSPLERLFGILSRFNPMRRERIGRRIMWVRGEWRGRVLDVGCGDGGLLHRLQQLGWKGVGYELDEGGAKTARDRYGLTVYEGDTAEVGKNEELFDLVTMSHVIEHLIDPVEDLRAWSQLLKPGGRLLVATPNYDSLGRRWFSRAWLALDPPRHIHIFNRKNLARCAEKAGLEVDFVRTSGASAKSIWRSSSLIRTEKNVTDERRARPPAYAKFGSRPFALLDQLLAPLGYGEELIAVFRKR